MIRPRPRVLILVALVLIIAGALILLEMLRGTVDVQAATPIRHASFWTCVHRHERSKWDDHDAPFWGGLQLSSWFHRTYASRRLSPATAVSNLYDVKGHADRWTPLEQIVVAELAWRSERYDVAWLRQQWPTSYGCVW